MVLILFFDKILKMLIENKDKILWIVKCSKSKISENKRVFWYFYIFKLEGRWG